MKKFMIRTSYAGVDNRARDLRNSEKITKKYDYKVEFVADKGVALSMTEADFAAFKRSMKDFGIDYLIDEEVDFG